MKVTSNQRPTLTKLCNIGPGNLVQLFNGNLEPLPATFFIVDWEQPLQLHMPTGGLVPPLPNISAGMGSWGSTIKPYQECTLLLDVLNGRLYYVHSSTRAVFLKHAAVVVDHYEGEAS